MRDALAGEMNRRKELLRAAGNFVSVTAYEQARRARLLGLTARLGGGSVSAVRGNEQGELQWRPSSRSARITLTIVAPRAEAPTEPVSRHRLGPRGMSFEAKRSRHVAVAISEIPVRRGIAVSLR
jgi:hypothetical protein